MRSCVDFGGHRCRTVVWTFVESSSYMFSILVLCITTRSPHVLFSLRTHSPHNYTTTMTNVYNSGGVVWTSSPVVKRLWWSSLCGLLWGHHHRYVQHSCFMYYNTIPHTFCFLRGPIVHTTAPQR